MRNAIRGVLTLGLFFYSLQAMAVNCVEVGRQLREMQKTQAILLTSMVKKNESLASVLDRYAVDFDSSERKVSKNDIQSLHGSAEAFRNHGAREMTLVEKFNKQSQDLIIKASSCLSKDQRLGSQF